MIDSKKSCENEIDETLYKSCLKQVVKHLNSRLPPLEDDKSSESMIEVEEKIKRPKKLQKDIVKEQFGDSYSIKDVTPTRKIKIIDEEKKGKRKRVNEFSLRKYNDIKTNKNYKRTKDPQII